MSGHQRRKNGTGSVKTIRGSNQSGMRAHNERLVLSLIRRMGPLPKAKIARLTGLSAQTVSVIMRGLEADGLLQKGEKLRGRVGQPSVPIGLKSDGAFFLGLKVGRRSLDMVLIDFVGKEWGRVHRPHRFPSPDSVVRFADAAIRQLLARLTPARRARVAGLGIAMPFRLWDWAEPLGIDPAEMEGWRDHDTVDMIAMNWDFPVYLQNDASAACGAELVFGDPDKPHDFLYFFIGFFAGGGLVLDNALFTGRTGNAAALGSIPIAMHGKTPRQLVNVASLASLESAVAARGGNGNLIWESPDEWSIARDVLDLWIGEASEGLAHAIASAACLVDVECAMIDGWMPADIRREIVLATRALLRDIHVAGIDLPDVQEGTIGRDAKSLGAASLPLSERFLVDRNTFVEGGS